MSTCRAKFACSKFSGWEGGSSLGVCTVKENSKSCSSAIKSFWSFVNKWKDKEEMFRPPLPPVEWYRFLLSLQPNPFGALRHSRHFLLLVFDAARDQWIATNSFLFLHLPALHKGSRMRVCVCVCLCDVHRCGSRRATESRRDPTIMCRSCSTWREMTLLHFYIKSTDRIHF